MPHAGAVDESPARALGVGDAASVDMRGHAADHPLRRGAEPGGPVGAYEIGVAADPARSDDHRLRLEGELPDHVARARFAPGDRARLEHGAGDPIDGAVGRWDLSAAMAEADFPRSGA